MNCEVSSLSLITNGATQISTALTDPRRPQPRRPPVAEIRLAAFTVAQVVEIIALVAANVFTNHLNNALHTDIDFPVVTAAQAA